MNAAIPLVKPSATRSAVPRLPSPAAASAAMGQASPFCGVTLSPCTRCPTQGVQSSTVVYRSVFRRRVNFAAPGWLLEQTERHVVIATVPGAQTAQLTGPRSTNLANLAAGAEEVQEMPWHTQRRVWVMPFGAAHAIGHFWEDATGEFLGHYINLQAPLQRSASSAISTSISERCCSMSAPGWVRISRRHRSR